MEDDSFDIPITFKNKELLFPAKLLQLGYTYKFQVNVNGVDICFEKDEEGNYRALSDTSKTDESKKVDIELLKAIAASIEEILK
jgi:hypothetical protein